MGELNSKGALLFLWLSVFDSITTHKESFITISFRIDLNPICEILAAASTDLEHTTLESANGIKTTWLLLPCPLPIVQSGGVCGEARRNRHASSFDSYDLWRNLQGGINGGQTARASFLPALWSLQKCEKRSIQIEANCSLATHELN